MVLNINALSEKSLRDAAKQIERYTKRLETNNRTYVKELVKVGAEEAHKHLSGRGDSQPPRLNDNPHSYTGKGAGDARAAVRLIGEDAVFVEFGAGIFYNQTQAGSSPHPLGVELGYTIGSYGQGNGTYDYWFYEKGDQTYISFGTEATMPLWNAGVAGRQKYADVAKRVFRS